MADARLLTAARQEAAAGRPVEVNWLTRPMDYRGRQSTEAPAAFPAPNWQDRYPGPNAFDWTTHRAGGGQDIGVAEAWRVLDLAGRLDNRVRVAIVAPAWVVPAPDRAETASSPRDHPDLGL